MAYVAGNRIIDKATIASGPNTYVWLDYSNVSRNGTDVTLYFWAKATLQHDSSYRADASHLTVNIKYDRLNDDGTITNNAYKTIYDADWKPQKKGSTRSGTGWPVEKSPSGTIKTVSSKCYVEINVYDNTGATDYDWYSGWKELEIPPGPPILSLVGNSHNCNSVTYTITNTINTNVTEYRLKNSSGAIVPEYTSGITFNVPIINQTPGTTVSGYKVSAYSNGIWGDYIDLPSVQLDYLPHLGGSVSQNSTNTAPDPYDKYCFILWEKNWLDNERISQIKYTIKSGNTTLKSETTMSRNEAIDNIGRIRQWYDAIEYYVLPVYDITDAQSDTLADNNKTTNGAIITFEISACVDNVWYSNTSSGNMKIDGRNTGPWYFRYDRYCPTVGNITSYGNVLTKINEIISSSNTSTPNTTIFKKYNSIEINYAAMTTRHADPLRYRIEETNNQINYKDSSSVNDRQLVLDNGVRNNSIKLTVYDSRSYSNSTTKSFTIVDYNLPTIENFVASRVGGVTTNLQLVANGSYTKWNSNFAIQNSFIIFQYYIGNSGWKNIPVTQDNFHLNDDGTWTLSTTITDELPLDQSTTSQIRILDVIGKRTQEIDTSLNINKYFDGYIMSNISTIPTGKVLVWRDLLNKWFGIGKKPTTTLDVAGSANIDTNLTIGNTINGHYFGRVLGAGTDLNYVEQNGWFGLGGSPVNGPTADWGTLIVQTSPMNGTPFQIYIDDAQNKIWKRSKQNGSWNPWILITKTVDDMYPIGSVYMTRLHPNEFNPNNVFGGNWRIIGNGYDERFLYVLNNNHSSWENGSAGYGTSTDASDVPLQAHTHTGTTSTNGAHTHTYGAWKPKRASDGSKWPTADNDGDYTTSSNGDHNHTFTTDVAGSGNGSHSHTVHYIGVFVWERYN